MRIGILGSGMIGSTLTTLLANSNYEVKMGGRDLNKLEKIAHDIGKGVGTGTLTDAAAFGEIVILALPWQSVVLEGALPHQCVFDGKIVVDAMNPYRRAGGGIHDTGDLSSSEHVAALVPRSFVIKAFNTIFWLHLRDQARRDIARELRRAIFIAGDDGGAKQRVSDVIDELGFAPVDTGSLHGSKVQEPGSPIYNSDLNYLEAISLLNSVRPTNA